MIELKKRDRLSFSSISMDVVVNTKGSEFECVKVYYLPNYGLRRDYEKF